MTFRGWWLIPAWLAFMWWGLHLKPVGQQYDEFGDPVASPTPKK